MKASAIFMTSIMFLATGVYSQQQYSAAKKFAETKERSGIDAAIIWLDSLDIGTDKQFTFDEKDVLEIGKEMRSFGYVEEAIRFLRAAAKFLPNSSAVWETLGYNLVRTYQKEEAVASYKRALEIDPKNRSAQGQLQMIDLLIEDTRNETRAKMRFKPGEATGLKGPYLGQAPPRGKPELFAPGIVSVFGSNDNTVTISPDGKEIYFGKEAGIWVCRLTDQGWTAPENTGLKGYEMWISPKNEKMYYTGYEPGIWAVARSGNTWGAPQRIVPNGMFSTLTDDGTLYTTVFDKKGKPNIGRYVRENGTYGPPEILGPEINTLNSFDAHPNIAPDGKTLIFDSNRSGGNGLYVSFRKDDGSWDQARFLGPEFVGASCSTFSPDGRFLFFMKGKDIYWVSSRIIARPPGAR